MRLVRRRRDRDTAHVLDVELPGEAARRARRHRLLIGLAVCVAACGGPPRWSDATVALRRGVTVPRPAPRGVADARDGIVYLRGVDDQLVAIDLRDGHVLWKSPAAQRPVIGLEGGVVALASSRTKAAYVIFDATGRQIGTSAPFALPEHDQLEVAAERLDGSTLRVMWTSWFEQGRTGTEQPPVALPPPVSATQDFDLATGTVTSTVIAAVDYVATHAVTLPAGNQGLELFGAMYGGAVPWRAGDRIVALVVVHGADDEQLVLRTWDLTSGRELLTKALVVRPTLRGYVSQVASADAAHVFLSSCDAQPPGGSPTGPSCRWQVYAVATGALVFEAPWTGPVAEVTIVGDRLLFRRNGPSPLSRDMRANPLIAHDLTTGARVWESVVSGHDNAYVP
jgi:PQQ-like domain